MTTMQIFFIHLTSMLKAIYSIQLLFILFMENDNSKRNQREKIQIFFYILLIEKDYILLLSFLFHIFNFGF